MKIKINQIVLLTFFALFTFIGCQDEAVEIDNPNEQEVITPNSSLTSFMSRVTANYGAYDNILDDSDCFSIELPVTIIVSDITIVIETIDDLEQLEELFEALEDDEDFLEFVFPITIVFNDYTEIIIENEDQLEAFIEDCEDDDEDEIIECVDFVYPISFSVFNSDFNIVDTVIIENDEALYNFLDDLEDDEDVLIVSLNYPVTLEYANGETIDVNSNEELADAIEVAEEDCDDDEDECDEEVIAELLLECPWNINDENEDFENYQIVFHESGDLQILEGETTSAIGGLWNLSSTIDGLILTLSELTAFQNDLGGEWLIVECDDDELEIVRGDYEIELEQDCEEEPDCTQEEVRDYLLSCNLVPTVNGYTPSLTTFQFSEDNTLFSMFEGDLPHWGTWDISSDDDGIFVIINFNGLDNFNGQWYLSDCSDDDGLIFYQGDSELILVCEESEDIFFECFEDREIEVCDDDGVNDGFVAFDLDAIYDCPQDNIAYTFHISFADADARLGALSSPFVNMSNPQTIYLRVELAGDANVYEIFEVELIVEDCSEGSCSEEDVDAFLVECIWNAVSYNGSDNLMNWNFDFESNSQIVVIYTDTDTIDATWTTSQSDEGVVVTFTNVTGPNIQAITGEWLVVECEENRLELHRADDILVMERICN